MRISDWSSDVCSSDLQRLVEALVTQAAVEALDIAVLLRLARRDVVPLDRSLLRPSQDRQAGQLGAVAAHDHQRRYASDGDDGVELPSDTRAEQPGGGNPRERSEERRGGNEWVKKCRSRGAQ